MAVVLYSQNWEDFLSYCGLEGWSIITLQVFGQSKLGDDFIYQGPDYFLHFFSPAGEGLYPPVKVSTHTSRYWIHLTLGIWAKSICQSSLGYGPVLCISTKANQWLRGLFFWHTSQKLVICFIVSGNPDPKNSLLTSWDVPSSHLSPDGKTDEVFFNNFHLFAVGKRIFPFPFWTHHEGCKINPSQRAIPVSFGEYWGLIWFRECSQNRGTIVMVDCVAWAASQVA